MNAPLPQYHGEVDYVDELYQKDYPYWIDTDFDDDYDSLYSSEYDFSEEAYNYATFKSAAPKDPRKYIDSYPKDDFVGKNWKPKKFIQILYLRNMYNTAKKFLKELQDIDIKDIPAKKTISTHLKNSKLFLKKANRFYEIDQISSLTYILKSIEEGRKVVERLKLYAIQKKI